MKHIAKVFEQRRAGVLLHISSLPKANLGKDAYQFVDFLASTGFSIWQMLPIGPHQGSPYQCFSAHAGNIDFIDWESWQKTVDIKFDIMDDPLAKAWKSFSQASKKWQQAWQDFQKQQKNWLEDFSLFMALKEYFQEQPWWQWPEKIKLAQDAAKTHYKTLLKKQIEQYKFAQFVFFQQWLLLKQYANEKGILLFGDMPIFVAHDSADVWAESQYFNMDSQGELITVAGVPPDYFSATGQRWGNPHYNWQKMQADDFAWWKYRLCTQLQLFDLIRIDHFRGFEAYWEIPAEEKTAIGGHWTKAPGEALFNALYEVFKDLPLVAEDLGVITEEVNALRLQFQLPGMKILQFAFNHDPLNPYLPHNHELLSVVYTGTHDNDTTLGWYHGLEQHQKDMLHDYLAQPGESMPWILIRLALASVARLAIIPLQDLLALDGSARMNTPGTTEHNWQWQFTWQQIPEDIHKHLGHLLWLYHRVIE